MVCKELKTTNFERLKPKMTTGMCILWRGNFLISEVIRQWTEYSHVSLIVRFNRYPLLKDKVFLIEAYEHGLEFNDLEERLEEEPGRVDLFVPYDLDKWKALTIFKNAFLFLAHNTGYDYAGLFKSAFTHPDRDPTRFFCSEFVDYIWITNGLKRKVNNTLAAWPGDIPKWWDGQLYTIKEDG